MILILTRPMKLAILPPLTIRRKMEVRPTGKEGRVADGHRGLVVDGLMETEQVLKAVLEPRGLQVNRVRGDDNAEAESDLTPPHVIVIHADESLPDSGRVENWGDVPRVIIGSAEFPGRAAADGRHYLTKPFQYRELIQVIERLLTDSSCSQ